jgi:hypothetical protein
VELFTFFAVEGGEEGIALFQDGKSIFPLGKISGGGIFQQQRRRSDLAEKVVMYVKLTSRHIKQLQNNKYTFALATSKLKLALSTKIIQAFYVSRRLFLR